MDFSSLGSTKNSLVVIIVNADWNIYNQLLFLITTRLLNSSPGWLEGLAWLRVGAVSWAKATARTAPQSGSRKDPWEGTLIRDHVPFWGRHRHLHPLHNRGANRHRHQRAGEQNRVLNTQLDLELDLLGGGCSSFNLFLQLQHFLTPHDTTEQQLRS